VYLQRFFLLNSALFYTFNNALVNLKNTRYMSTSSKEIYNSRILKAPLKLVYNAFANPDHLRIWWGPEGFSNTFHEFDLRPEGSWRLTMHGPEKGNYENASVFKVVEPQKRIGWTRISQPYFDMEVSFEAIDASTSKIAFKMLFETEEGCNKIRSFAGPKNEENFDRLERLLKQLEQF
jgi:uncharacterized protein YndB with AHSA1/START domain